MTFSGCFTAPPGNVAGPDLKLLGWGKDLELSQADDLFDLQLCVAHCAQSSQQYAAVSKVRSGVCAVSALL